MTKEEIPYALRTSAMCLYNGTEYTVQGFYLYADKKTKALKYAADLLDKCGHSIIRVPLESVELKGDDTDNQI